MGAIYVPKYTPDELHGVGGARWRVVADRISVWVGSAASAGMLFKSGYEMGQGDTGDMVKSLGFTALAGVFALGRGLRAQEMAPQVEADLAYWSNLEEDA